MKFKVGDVVKRTFPAVDKQRGIDLNIGDIGVVVGQYDNSHVSVRYFKGQILASYIGYLELVNMEENNVNFSCTIDYNSRD